MFRRAVKSLARSLPPRLTPLLSRRSDAQLPVWAVGCGVAAVALTVTCVASAAKPENPLVLCAAPTCVAVSVKQAAPNSMTWLDASVFSPLQPVALTSPANANELLESASSALAYPLYRIDSHVQMAEVLLRFCQGLSSGRYFGTTGIHARALQAPKGEGKTTLLRAFTAVCQSVFPDIIPVYISYADFGTDKHLQTKCVHEIVLDQLVLRGVLKRKEISGSNTMSLISKALERSNRRVLLLVDEFDELYRVDRADEPELARLAKASMRSVSSFANLSTGRVGVVVCGSTASLRKLLSCNPGTDKGFWKEFPNLAGAPHLNGTKFARFVVKPSPCVDLSVARAVLEAQSTFPVKESTVRLAAFVGGSNSRALATAVEEGFNASSIRSPSQAEEVRRRMSSFDGAFLSALMRRTWERNDPLLGSLLEDGKLFPSAKKVMSTKWETGFSSMPLTECIQIFAEVAETHDPGHVLYKDARDAVDVLCDLGYLTQFHDREEVFPSSLGQVFVCRGKGIPKDAWYDSWTVEVAAQIGTPLASGSAKAAKQ
jgi:hypothetical protein